jgi:hypothetical protein
MTLSEQLLEPFEPAEVKWKPQVVRANRALAIAYIDARLVEDRLDAVFGVEGWQDSYQVLPSLSVVCIIRVKVGTEWIEKSDVGSQSDQPDEGDRLKSAFSDALKRAAVKLGIGRYLYGLPHQWVDYDPQTRQLKGIPSLPEWAKPKKRGPAQEWADWLSGDPTIDEINAKLSEVAALPGEAKVHVKQLIRTKLNAAGYFYDEKAKKYVRKEVA